MHQLLYMKSYPKRSKVRRNFSKTRGFGVNELGSPADLDRAKLSYHINQIPKEKILIEFFDPIRRSMLSHQGKTRVFPDRKKQWSSAL